MSVLVLLYVYSEEFKRKMLIYANINEVFHTIMIIALSIPFNTSQIFGLWLVFCCCILLSSFDLEMNSI